MSLIPLPLIFPFPDFPFLLVTTSLFSIFASLFLYFAMFIGLFYLLDPHIIDNVQNLYPQKAKNRTTI